MVFNFKGKSLGYALMAACLLPFATLQAQSYEEYVSQRVNWEDGPLTWDAFQMVRPADAPDTLAFQLSMVSAANLKTQKVGRTTYEYFWPRNFVQPSESWIDPNNRFDERLGMAQVSFDLWELFSRKVFIEYATAKEYVSFDDLMEYYNRLRLRREEELRTLTANGSDSISLRRYSAIVRQELEQTTFDAAAFADTVSISNSGFFSLGIQSNINASDYVSCSFGVDMAVGFSVRSMLYGLTMDLSGAKCRKFIETHNGEIHEGDRLFAGSINAIVGRNALRRPNLSVTPYMGIGVKFYDGGVNFDYESGDKNADKTTEKAGFSLGMGALVDIPLKRTVGIKTVRAFGITESAHCLQLKPYLSMTKFHGDMGWMPSVNIAISYVWKSGGNRNL